MSLFYYDETIDEFERELDFNAVINYMEQKFLFNHDILFVRSLIIYNWYYLVEGDINQHPINYDWGFFKNKLELYINLGLKEFANDLSLCYVIGYVLNLHWEYLGKSYEKIGKELMHKCASVNDQSNIQSLALFFKNKSITKDMESICNELFPSQSLVDKYFRYILTTNK